MQLSRIAAGPLGVGASTAVAVGIATGATGIGAIERDMASLDDARLPLDHHYVPWETRAAGVALAAAAVGIAGVGMSLAHRSLARPGEFVAAFGAGALAGLAGGIAATGAAGEVAHHPSFEVLR